MKKYRLVVLLLDGRAGESTHGGGAFLYRGVVTLVRVFDCFSHIQKSYEYPYFSNASVIGWVWD